MKTVYLDTPSHPITISNEAFEMVKELIVIHRVCATCGLHYVDRSPCVALNLCLDCFQKKYVSKKLTYVGILVYPTTIPSEYVTHQFVDPAGTIYLSGTSSAHEPEHNSYYTLVYWGFPVPEKVMRSEEEVPLNIWYWSIFGDVKRNSVIYIEHGNRFADEKPVAFLSYKHGTYKEVNKRQKYFQVLFKKARETLEATKDAHGDYHVGDHTAYGMYPASINEMVSELASREYDQGHKP